jgi:AraC-like DNA-binding protein
MNRCETMTQLIALTERHYSVKELAQLWGLSATAIRRMFRNEPGVLRFGRENKGHQRDYVTLRIPVSVAERVYRRCLRPNLVPSLLDRNNGGP